MCILNRFSTAVDKCFFCTFARQFPTDRGMCCTFNMEKADKMFVKGQYSNEVRQMQIRDASLATPTGAVDLPEWYTKAEEPIPQSGVNKGLSLILDAHTNLLSPGIVSTKCFCAMLCKVLVPSNNINIAGSVTEDFRGFIAVVEDRRQYPLTDQKNIRIRPG